MYQLSLKCPSSRGPAWLLGVESTCCLQSGSGRVRIRSQVFSFLINFWSALKSQNHLEEQTPRVGALWAQQGLDLFIQSIQKAVKQLSIWTNQEVQYRKLAGMVSRTWEKTCPSTRLIRVVFLVTGFPHFSAGFLSHFIYIQRQSILSTWTLYLLSEKIFQSQCDKIAYTQCKMLHTV